MTIARILVPVRDDGKARGVFAHAAALARRANAHVECVHCRARAEDFMPFGVNVPRGLRETLRQAAQSYAASQEEDLAKRFRERLAEHDLEETPLDAPPAGRASASLEEVEGKMAEVIRARGRLADIVAVAKPARDRNIGENSLRAALFQTGRPVLMCPPGDTLAADPGSHVAVAWNGALEATRAVALATPLLRLADRVSVLDGAEPNTRVSGDALVTYLAAHGVTARATRLEAGRDPGRAILEAAAGLGASLVVSGAYGHSREHETVFGGATQTMVDTARLAVMMTH
ncbi:MAG: universal stress protein [Paracoccaceae bacterium]